MSDIEYKEKIKYMKELIILATSYLSHKERNIRILAAISLEYAKDKLKVLTNQENG